MRNRAHLSLILLAATLTACDAEPDWRKAIESVETYDRLIGHEGTDAAERSDRLNEQVRADPEHRAYLLERVKQADISELWAISYVVNDLAYTDGRCNYRELLEAACDRCMRVPQDGHRFSPHSTFLQCLVYYCDWDVAAAQLMRSVHDPKAARSIIRHLNDRRAEHPDDPTLDTIGNALAAAAIEHDFQYDEVWARLAQLGYVDPDEALNRVLALPDPDPSDRHRVKARADTIAQLRQLTTAN